VLLNGVEVPATAPLFALNDAITVVITYEGGLLPGSSSQVTRYNREKGPVFATKWYKVEDILPGCSCGSMRISGF
jgi:hypothetical protein